MDTSVESCLERYCYQKTIGENMKDGFYYLKTKDGSESPTLVYGYSCTDLCAFVFGFNFSDGGGFIRMCDLSDNVIIVPVNIVES